MKTSKRFLWSMLGTFLLGWQPTYAQVREAWVTQYPGTEDEYPWATHLFATTLDHQSNPVVTGISYNDFLTIKYDRATGQPLWVARDNITAFDLAKAVTVDFRGDVYVIGFIHRSAGSNDIFTVKYVGNTGQRLWSAEYNGPANGRDEASALAVDSQGNLLVVGSSTGIGTGSDYISIKYDGQTGRPIWTVRYSLPGNTNEGASAVAIDREDNVLVTGTAGTLKYDGQTGQVLWGPIATGVAYRIIVDPQGDVLVAGGSNQTRLETYKLSGRTGQLLWTVFSPVGVVGGARAIALDSAGDIIVTGGSEVSANGRVEKYSGQTGETLWSISLRGWCIALAVDREGHVYVTGISSGGFPGPMGDFRTVKLDGRTGRLWWRRTYPDAQARAIEVDEENNLYVSGDLGPDIATRYMTIKYEQAPPGDVDFDFCVDDGDLLRVLDTFGQSGELPEDVNRDGVVDDQDLLTVLFNFGRGCGME